MLARVGLRGRVSMLLFCAIGIFMADAPPLLAQGSGGGAQMAAPASELLCDPNHLVLRSKKNSTKTHSTEASTKEHHYSKSAIKNDKFAVWKKEGHSADPVPCREMKLQCDELVSNLKKHGDTGTCLVSPLMTPALDPNDLYFPNQWALKNTGQFGGSPGVDIGATAAWDITTGSDEVIVAVIDTGVDYTHPDLAANIWQNPLELPGDGNGDGCPGKCGIDDDHDGLIDEDLWGCGSNGFDINHSPCAYQNDADADDDEDGCPDDYRGCNFAGVFDGIINNDPMDIISIPHGTGVASVIGAVANNGIGIAGVNHRVKILPVKVGDSGSLSSTATYFAYEYIRSLKLLGHNIVVANASYTSNLSDYPDEIELEAAFLQPMLASGVILTAAAGNSGHNIDAPGLREYPVSQPFDRIVGVGSVNKSARRSTFSNVGQVSVDIFAPGENIEVASKTASGPSYWFVDGTSVSAPYVAGAIALLSSTNLPASDGSNDQLTPDEIVATVLASGTPYYYLGGSVSRLPYMLNLPQMFSNLASHGAPDCPNTKPDVIATLPNPGATPLTSLNVSLQLSDTRTTNWGCLPRIYYLNATITGPSTLTPTIAAFLKIDAGSTLQSLVQLPVYPASPGSYHLSVTAVDEGGEISATDEVTFDLPYPVVATPTPTPTATPTPTPTPTATPSPTPTAAPTFTPAPTATAKPTPTVAPSPAPTSPPVQYSLSLKRAKQGSKFRLSGAITPAPSVPTSVRFEKYAKSGFKSFRTIQADEGGVFAFSVKAPPAGKRKVYRACMTSDLCSNPVTVKSKP